LSTALYRTTGTSFVAVGAEAPEHLEAVDPGHHPVEHDHIGPDRPGHVQRLVAVGGAGGGVAHARQQPLECVTRRFVVVDHEDEGHGGAWYADASRRTAHFFRKS
jgi:hypothetical protein